MQLQEFSVCGYRSVREVRLVIGGFNLIVGANGSGKTNLYRAMQLLHFAADGRLARAISNEGGMASVLWAGRRRKGPVRVKLSVTFETMEYEISLGLPIPGNTMFYLDPSVNLEKVWMRAGPKRVCLLERENASAWGRDAEGNRASFPHAISTSESILSELREPARFPELAALRQELLGWRFYHQFRTDPESPSRHPQNAVSTPILSHDGADLAAALQTIRERGDADALNIAIHSAFPEAILLIDDSGHRLSVGLKMPEIPRPFSQTELSDGTLHYLCLMAALLSPRPPALLALNEPETSIHPDLYPALAGLLVRASERSQLWVTTHSEALARLTRELSGSKPIRLEKIDGETRVHGYGILGPKEESDQKEPA